MFYRIRNIFQLKKRIGLTQQIADTIFSRSAISFHKVWMIFISSRRSLPQQPRLQMTGLWRNHDLPVLALLCHLN